MAQGVPGRLRPRIFLTFGTTRVVGRQPYAPAAFTPRRNPWYSFLEAESTPGHMVPSVTTEKIPSDTTGNRSRGRPTSSAVPQPLRYPKLLPRCTPTPHTFVVCTSTALPYIYSVIVSVLRSHMAVIASQGGRKVKVTETGGGGVMLWKVNNHR